MDAHSKTSTEQPQYEEHTQNIRIRYQWLIAHLKYKKVANPSTAAYPCGMESKVVSLMARRPTTSTQYFLGRSFKRAREVHLADSAIARSDSPLSTSSSFSRTAFSGCSPNSLSAAITAFARQCSSVTRLAGCLFGVRENSCLGSLPRFTFSSSSSCLSARDC